MRLLTFLLLFVFHGGFCQNSKLSLVQTQITSYALKYNFSGTVLIQKNGGIIYHKCFGLANRQFSVPCMTYTKFKIASITKLFTAVLVLQLYEKGKIDLNETIDTYLPNYTGEAASKVTIHQLLNHTSGLTNIDTVSSIENAIKYGLPVYQHPYTSDELLAKFCMLPLVTEPGKVFNYNNADYIILGKIIEGVTGNSFEKVLHESILQPLHMYNSGMLYQHSIINRLADTYFFKDSSKKQLINDLPVYIQNWYAAGAMYSSAVDLSKFTTALFKFQLVRKETLDLLLQPGLDDYGYGVWLGIWKFNNKEYFTIQRPGSIMGAQVKLVHIFKENTTIIILGNTSATDVDEFAYKIGKYIFSY